ncbi:L-threonine dehydratase catabolic TdcB [Sodalis praecaptivus]
MPSLIELSAIRAAAIRISRDIIRTASILSPGLSAMIKRPVYLKLENTQIGGSFKARGVLNKFAGVAYELSSGRFVAVSGGNFGIALAQAAAKLHAMVTIIMPQTAPAASMRKIRALGANVIVTDDVKDAFAHAERLAQAGDKILDDCADTAIAEGHGTLALEFIEDCPALTDVFVAVGGGRCWPGLGQR